MNIVKNTAPATDIPPPLVDDAVVTPGVKHALALPPVPSQQHFISSRQPFIVIPG